MDVSEEKSAFSLFRNWSRRGFIVAALAVSATADAKAPAHRMPHILFVCQYGTAKSAIAREVFRRRARERGLAVSAISRGLTIEDHISPPLRQRLLADGVDPSSDAPQILAPKDWRQADILVAFNLLPNSVKPAKMLDWTDMPSFNDDYDNAIATLDRRIDDLLDEIGKMAGKK